MATVEAIVVSVERLLGILMKSSKLTEAITYKSLQSQDYDPEQRRNVSIFAEYQVRAINVSKVFSRTMQNQLPFSVVGVTYLVMAKDVPSNLSSRDKIEIGGVLLQVKDTRPILGIAWGISTEGES